MPSRWFVRTGIGALVLLVFLSLSAPLAAQDTGRITGRVTSETDGRPLQGVQVLVQGPGLGGLTTAEGQFLILNVPAGTYTLRVEMFGRLTIQRRVTVSAGGTATLNLIMTETAIDLEGLVVTGTAADVRAREVGNSLDAVTSRQIENLPVIDPQDILGGRIPGLTVMQVGGSPGMGSTIRIRSQLTASQTSEPLMYIDGVRVYNSPISTGSNSRGSISPLQDINAEDIERIEVIKGASATTLYGTEAANGVIQIFTKRGIAGAPIWTAKVTAGFSDMGQIGPDGDPTQLYTQCDALDDFFGLSQSNNTLGEKVFFQDATCPKRGNWFKRGGQQRYSLSVRGGSQNVAYYVSSHFSDNNGTLDTQRSRDGGFRANLDFSPTEAFSIALNTSYTRRASRFVEDGNNANGFLLNVGRGTNGNFKGGRTDECANVTVLCVTNSFLFESESDLLTDRYTTGLVVDYRPTDNWSNRVTVGWDYLNMLSEQWDPFGHLRSPGGNFSSETQTRQKLSLDYSSSYRNNFGENLVSTFSAGGQLFRTRSRRTFVSTRDFAGPGKPTLTSGGGSTGVSDSFLGMTTAGFFLQEVIGWNDRLFVTAGLRVDGSSAFGDNFGLQKYPKASVAFIVSDYDFWPTDLIETFKLRGAWGEAGKAPGVFDKLRTFSPVTGDEGTAGFTPNDVGNQDVGPERTREIEVGFDASFLNGRFGLEATYYNTKTSDALVPVTLPPSLGFLSARTENVGEITGSGVEFQVTSQLYRSDNFEWHFLGNFAFSKNEATALEGQEIFGDNKAEVREGFAVPTYFGRKVMNPDEFAEPIIERGQRLGNVNPTRLIGLNTNFTLFQRFTVDALFEHQGGHMLPNYTGYQNSRRGVWHPCFEVQAALVEQKNGNDALLAGFTAEQRAKCRMNGIGGNQSDFWVEKADFWKLRSVAVTVHIPTRLLQGIASRGTFTLSGTNLALWTDYTGNDPELEDFRDRAEAGIFDGTGDFGRREYYNIPAPRTFLASLRLTF